jgi:beta propeller repeat protein
MRHRSTLVRLFVVGLVAAALLAAAAPASASWFLPETRLGSDPASQAGCDVSGAKVVYSDGRYGNYDVFLYDLVTGIETRLTKNSANQADPVISGTWVAYEDDRNGSATSHDIFVYDLVTRTERRITPIAGDQSDPAISGNRVAWQDDRSGNDDIYVRNLKTDVTRRLTSQAAAQRSPAISGTRVVWEDRRNGNLDIYLYDMVTSRLKRLTTNTQDDYAPAISGTRVAYVAMGPGGALGHEIAVHDLSRGVVEIIDDGTAPDIDGARLVYVTATFDAGAITDPHLDITYHDLTLGLEQQATLTGLDASSPAISGSRIVYQRGWFDLLPWPGSGEAHVYLTPLALPKLTARADATVVPYETAATLTGGLTATGGSFIDGKTITLQYSADRKTWTDGMTAATARGGNVVIQSPALRTARHLRLRWAGDAEFLGAASTPILVKPRVFLTTPSASLSVKRDAAFTTTGFLKPRHRANSYPVKIECFHGVKQADGSLKYVFWKAVRASASDYSTYTKYKASLSLPYSGTWRIRAWHPADAQNASTRTAWREFTVR